MAPTVERRWSLRGLPPGQRGMPQSGPPAEHLTEESTVTENPSSPPETAPQGQTPGAPDVDQPEGGDGGAGRTPGTPDSDQPEGGEDA